MLCQSWGGYPPFPQQPHAIYWPEAVATALAEITAVSRAGALPYGLGRSYGDVCLAASDHVLTLPGLDRLLAVDWETGTVHAQAGLSLADLIALVLPRGWFLPVTPGTQFVTLGGAVANDVHGKSHHISGTFGRHINRLQLYRSDQGVVECSPQQNSELFAATIGGLGLTGVILSVELQLKPLASSDIEEQTIRFEGLDEFFALSQQYDATHEYTVAWIDCLAKGSQIGRGLYTVGNPAPSGPRIVAPAGRWGIPCQLPCSLVNPRSVRWFNHWYYQRQRQQSIRRRVHYATFLYPLDKLLHWNRLYGRAGFQQYQCVIPQQQRKEVLHTLLQMIAQSGRGSFLAVLKQCGPLASPGLLSFPLHGTSLALDFPQRDVANQALFTQLDAVVHEAGGRLYPAKDAHMSAQHFQQAYPQWQQVEALRDPQLLSRFWQRVIQ